MTDTPNYKRMWENLETRVANEKDNLELRDCLAGFLNVIRKDEERSVERDCALERAHKDFRGLFASNVLSITQKLYTPHGKSKSIMATDVRFRQIVARYDRLKKEDVMAILREEFEDFFKEL